MADNNIDNSGRTEFGNGGSEGPIDSTATAPVAIEDNEALGAGSPTGPRGEDDVDVTFTPDPLGGDAIADDAKLAAAGGPGGSAGASGSAGGGSGTGEKTGTVQLLKSEAGKLGEEATSKARSLVGDGKDRATAKLGEFSQLLNDAADTVDEKLGEQYGKYARDAATRVTGFADSLADKDIDDLLDDARGFVRASPAVAIGTAAAVGFVLARLLHAGVDAARDRGPA